MAPRSPLSIARFVLIPFLAAGTLLPSAARGQIPDTFENLQLLDPGISKADLVGTMRSWATGLGVRCNHCHVGPDNLVGMDFASDEKATKQTARKMLELSRVLNRELLADLPTVDEGSRHQVVSCFTCHRGQPTPPRTTASVFRRTAAEAGIDAALDQFDELRAEHYGAGVYDFTEAALAAAAGELLQTGQTDDAIKVLEKNFQYYPDSADNHAIIAMVHVRAGNADAARAAVERALEIDPENRTALHARQMLDAPSPTEPSDDAAE